jgi:phage gp36-like protein
MFLQKEDYDNIIRRDILERVIDNNDSYRITAEYNAQSVLETYLRNRYDVTAIFSSIGDNRNRTIVRYMIDIVLYDLFSRIAPEQMNELRLTRYEEAIQWLKDVRDGKISPDLPKNSDDLTVPKKNTFVSSKYPSQNFDF